MTKESRFTPVRERPVAELVAERLNEIPTHFGRLIYLARCRDEQGRYRHDGLGTTHEARTIHTALLKAHEEEFRGWLALSLREQAEEVTAFMTGLNRQRVLKAWCESEPWHAIAPPTAEAHERDLFTADFRALLQSVLQRKDRWK